MNVFQPLDGRWKGEFTIYQDEHRRVKSQVELKHLTRDMFNSMRFRKIGNIEVEQEYISESPFFQRVEIKDHIPNEGKTIVSKGVNKVENGTLRCIVIKPDEVVVHQGSIRGRHTILWERSEENPRRVEFFQETVEKEKYQILGWGYYEGDDLNLSPRMWFLGEYLRVD